MRRLTEWTPLWARSPVDGALTVHGRHEELDRDEPEAGQRVECRCARCGTEYRALCMSGNPRAHIAKFALEHQTLHYRWAKTLDAGKGGA